MPLSYWRLIGRGKAQDETVFLGHIRRRFGAETQAIAVGRARSGIYSLVKAAICGSATKVLLSPFTIPDVITLVELAGGQPVFYDFEPRSTSACLASLSRQIDCRTACVIITHHHVNEPRMTAIADLCRRVGAKLFDDCAIAFGGDIDGVPIGTIADASVFSFSSFKLLNYFWGGLITTRDPDLAKKIEVAVNAWPRLRPSAYLRQAKACARYDFASRPFAFGSIVFPMVQRRMRASTEARGLENVRIESEKLDATLTSRPALAAFAEWSSKLENIDAWLAHRRSIALIYRRMLGEHMVGADTPDRIRQGSCFVNFPVVAPRECRDEIARAMILDGFDVGYNLYPNCARHPRFIGVEGESANVDRLVSSSIYLPTHFAVTPSYAQAIAARLSEYLSAAA